MSLAQFGAFAASLFSGPLQDRIGRKPTILIADVLFTAGAVIMAFSTSVPMLMAGRVVVGLGVGMASLVVPVYLSEVSPTEVRGTVVAVDVMVITAGQFISSVLCWALGKNWRLMLGLAGVPSVL